jgi:hypothetical protein
VKCNEVGFREDNVRAICNVNKSTKKERKQVEDGCIGEKGIGKYSVWSAKRKASNPSSPSPAESLFTQMASTFSSIKTTFSE